MTNSPNPPYNQPWAPPPPPPEPAKKKRRTGLWLGLAFACLLMFGGCLAVVLVGASEVAKAPGAKPLSSVTAHPPTARATTEAPPSPADYTPKPADFALGVKVLSKECFDTAGCLISYRVDFTKVPRDAPDDGSFEVTYKVRGAKEEIVDTIVVTDGNYDPAEGFTETASQAKKLSAVVVSIERTD